jgi:protein-tyrosine phosphatase
VKADVDETSCFGRSGTGIGGLSSPKVQGRSEQDRQALFGPTFQPTAQRAGRWQGSAGTDIHSRSELSLLGASEDEIVHEFALIELATDRLIADWKTANPNRELRWPGYG